MEPEDAELSGAVWRNMRYVTIAESRVAGPTAAASGNAPSLVHFIAIAPNRLSSTAACTRIVRSPVILRLSAQTLVLRTGAGTVRTGLMCASPHYAAVGHRGETGHVIGNLSS
jgi:hypothetical protein